MRKALNDNPLMQVAVLGVLAVIVAFMLMTRVGKHDSGSTSSPTSSTEQSVAPATPTAPSAAPGEFVAGPGLPAPVVEAYADGKVVVLLVVRRHGIDDDAVRASVELLRNGGDVALFVTNAGHIARYARITEGVNVDRVPALIVIRPGKQSQGTPVATVAYGFRGTDSVVQAIQDALYKGPRNLPSYPK